MNNCHNGITMKQQIIANPLLYLALKVHYYIVNQLYENIIHSSYQYFTRDFDYPVTERDLVTILTFTNQQSNITIKTDYSF